MNSESSTNLIDKLPRTIREELDKNLCTCMDVPGMEIINSIINGATTVDEVKAQTSATMGAGCCIQQIERLIEILCAPEPKKRSKRRSNAN